MGRAVLRQSRLEFSAYDSQNKGKALDLSNETVFIAYLSKHKQQYNSSSHGYYHSTCFDP